MRRSTPGKFKSNGCPLDVGTTMHIYFKKKFIRWAPLSRALGRHINTVLDYKNSKSMQTALIWEISKVLKHNFLADLAAQLPKEWSTDAVPDPSIAETRRALEKEVAELKEALKIVTTERDVLLKVMGKVG